jgi:hypothetical protein
MGRLDAYLAVAEKAGPGVTIEKPSILVQMSASFIDRERVLAKIGLNLCAFVFGESFVRKPFFDDIKSSILKAAPAIQSKDTNLLELPAENIITKIFSAVLETTISECSQQFTCHLGRLQCASPSVYITARSPPSP